MILYSTANHQNKVSFVEAVQNAFPQDKGLYFPENIPKCPPEILARFPELSFSEIALEISRLWLNDEVPASVLEEICHSAFDFPVPLVPLGSGTRVMELFQGPTMAFKDFGARFMARLLDWIVRGAKKKIVVLTATSGDTGGAVASGFAGMEDLEVVILFPEGKVSPLQRKQLTTLGSNIHALSIQGNFDDCQRMVKEALLDPDILQAAQFCSANSINIARLLPQSFYYFYAWSRSKDIHGPLVFSVPSGNFGNLTGGLFARAMGLDNIQFIAATNENDSVPEYLRTGEFHPHPSLETLATAMDVGHPSNFVRLVEIFKGNLEGMRSVIKGIKVSDTEIKETIIQVFDEYHYVLDPHTAVGFHALEQYRKEEGRRIPGFILGTAHPAKFPETVEKELGTSIPLPDQLSDLLGKEEHFDRLTTNFHPLKQYLLEKVLNL